MKLTFNRIQKFGFKHRHTDVNASKMSWSHFQIPENKFILSLCLQSANGFKKGSWYYGSDFIKIDTVEELKMLYLLVTKKELLNN